MNNIELRILKEDLKKYLGYTDELVRNVGMLPEPKLLRLKKQLIRIKNDEYEKSDVKKKVDKIFSEKPELLRRRILEKSQPNLLNIKKTGNPKSTKVNKPKISKNPTQAHVSKQSEFQSYNENTIQRINVVGRKPRIVFITDVKGWAWWIKSEYLKKYLSDEFDIDIVNVIDDNINMQYGNVDQNKYDLYFSYGFSYVDFLSGVPKNKKITGITAHRKRSVIFPQMKKTGHHHANSMMLLKELQDMGFKRAYYVPNGVNEELFKPIKPINPKTELIIGHVGKECAAKGQREFILPAITATGCKSATNLRTWRDKLPHDQMPLIYNDMDVFMVASVEDGTPNPALEAAACGRPIISNRIGNMPELIKDGYNGFLVERKISAYVEKINFFKENPDELVRMGENARKSILEDWTWKRQAERYRDMFHDIFGMKGENNAII